MFGATAHIHLSWCQRVVGLWEAAAQTLAVATELADVYGRPYDHAALRSASAIGLALHGETSSARGELAESVRLSARADFLGPSFHHVLARATIAWSEGAFSEVIARLKPLLRRSTDQPRRTSSLSGGYRRWPTPNWWPAAARRRRPPSTA